MDLPILCECLLQHLYSGPVWRSNADPWKFERAEAIDLLIFAFCTVFPEAAGCLQFCCPLKANIFICC